MTVGQLLEILNDPDLSPDTPVRIRTSYRVSTWEWELEGAHGTLAGPDRHLVLELRAVTLADEGKEASR